MTPARYALALGLALGAGWLCFAMGFVLRPAAPRGATRAREPLSNVGVVLQMAGYAVVWLLHRRPGTPFVGEGPVAEWGWLLATALLGIASGLFAWAATRALGQAWSLTARVLDNHPLALGGPYAIVRHPIYTAMLGLLLASAFAVSHWSGALLGLAIFLVGTRIRIRLEERLLRGSFGGAYDAYAARVPALLPRPASRPSRTAP